MLELAANLPSGSVVKGWIVLVACVLVLVLGLYLKGSFGEDESTSPAPNEESVEDWFEKKAGAGGTEIVELVPPVTLEAGEVSGTGRGRRATIKITNEGEKTVRLLQMEILYLRSDQTVGKSVPSTTDFGEDGLAKGASSVDSVRSTFMDDDTVAVAGLVRSLEFADGSHWPVGPEKKPEPLSGSPIGMVLMGMIGKGKQALPILGCHNYSDSEVTDLIEYLGRFGQVINTTDFIYGSSDALMKAGGSCVISGGDPPWAEATTARISILGVSFADGSEWSESTTDESAEKAVGQGESKLGELKPPATVKVSEITGAGEDRKAKITIENLNEKKIESLRVEMLFLRKGGSVGARVLKDVSGGSQSLDSSLEDGETATIKVSSFFMEENTVAVGGQITLIEYEDGSIWPSLPETAPTAVGDAPVGGVVMGLLGQGDQAQPVVAFHNHSTKEIKEVDYGVEYLRADGEVVSRTIFGYGSFEAIMKREGGCVLAGGNPPLKGAVDARVVVTKVVFMDESEWSAQK